MPSPACAWSSDLVRHLRLLLAFVVLAAAALARAEEAGVWVALSEGGGPYAEAAAVLRDELALAAPRRIELRVAPWEELRAGQGRPPQIIVTVGAAAFRGVVEQMQREGGGLPRVPVLATLLPRTSYEALAAKARLTTSAVYLDQPAARYIDLLRLAMPERKRVGVLYGPESAALDGALSKAAAARGVQLVTAHVAGEEDIYPALETVLKEADVLLALPDTRVFNGGTLQNILITSYRQRVPLAAFSAAYVRAGATLALYSSPAHVASQAAKAVRAVIAGRGLPAPQGAGEFAVASNDRVARSLGLPLDDVDTLAEALRRQEGQR